MLSTVTDNHHLLFQQPEFVPDSSDITLSNNDTTVLKNNFRSVEHHLGQHQNSPGLLDEYPGYYDSNFEVANRAFYATINKFTRQSCPDASRRRSPPYSFLENWHLHSIYSKSQQTLLGITPVRPSVLLSGDDFMFTPPFIQQEEEEEEYDDLYQEDEEWDNANEFYSLSPCPESNQAGELTFYKEDNLVMPASSSYPPTTPCLFETPISPNATTKKYYYDQQDGDYFNSFAENGPLIQENIWMENERRAHSLSGFESMPTNLLSIQIPPPQESCAVIDMVDTLPSPEESELSSSSSSSDEQHMLSSSNCSISSSDTNFYNDDNDEQDQQMPLSSSDLMNLYDTTFPSGEELNRQQDVAHISPVTRSASLLSQKSSPEETSSVMSYQSLADLIHQQHTASSKPSYGTIETNIITHPKDLDQEEMGAPPTANTTSSSNNSSSSSSSNWMTIFVYIMSLWQLLVRFATSSSTETEPLLN